MVEQIVVIALDGADYRLLKNWDCNHLLMNNHQKIQTESFSRDYPYTLEIWPSVATGIHPSEHEIGSGEHSLKFNNPLLGYLSSFAHILPIDLREAIGKKIVNKDMTSGYDFPILEQESIFDDAHSWIGVSDAYNLGESWKILHKMEKSGYTLPDMNSKLQNLSFEELSYALNSEENGIIGIHLHILDVAGHLYCNDEKKLYKHYKWTDSIVGWFLNQIQDNTDVVILSDHGMNVSWLDDDDPGGHSWYPYIATTMSDIDLPSNIMDVFGWLSKLDLDGEGKSSTKEQKSLTESQVNQLKELGYIN
jgi:hypothetical protein